MEMMPGMSGMMAFMVLAWLAVIGAVVAGVWWMIRNVRSRGRNAALEPAARPPSSNSVDRREPTL